ncbi:efflux transporter outer membrane subunit [Pseudomonas sp. LS44]|uniref:efflux transporter outer membrane subunit n=1 Tax=Pseudomonas sp. LS44 TaxID=1357074 RepID=UPI00215ABFD8|nr:efflux transporter outer membrane subunit [Pseudomonas sp. LS44]UVE19687.1 efflux transporter outer membrane subunit [Pseudomonas sp. LS44]
MSTGGIAPRQQQLAADQLATDTAIQSANRDAGWPQERWWMAYGDPQLNAWIDNAVHSSPTLAVAAARIRQALAMAGAAEAAESPQVNAEVKIQRHKWPTDFFYGPGELADTSTWNNEAALGLSYALDLWGRDRSDSERAHNFARMAAAEARVAQLELESNIVRSYVKLSLQYAELDIAHAMLQQQQEILALAEDRLSGGLGTDFEVSQAQVPLPETRRKIEALEESIALTRNQLAALAGKGPGAGASLQRPRLQFAGQIGLPSSVPAELLGRRPDVVASRWRVAATAKGVDVARAGFYPNVDLLASVGFNAVGGGMLEYFKSQKFNYSVGPAVTLPIFDGGRLRAELGESSAAYDAAVAQYNQTLVTALKSISDQLITLRSMDQQAQFAAQSVQAAQTAYQLAREAYDGGLTDYLNVLQTQTSLFQQQLTEQQVQASRLAAHADLLVALGGGLMGSGDTPAPAKLVPETVPVQAR